MALSQDELNRLQQKLTEIERLSRSLGVNINTLNLQDLEANAGAIEQIFNSLNILSNKSDSLKIHHSRI